MKKNNKKIKPSLRANGNERSNPRKRLLQSLRFFAMTIILLAIAPAAHAQEEITIPAYQGYVNDFANIINTNDEQEILNFAHELELKTTAQLAVLTIPTTKPMAIEQYAVAVFEKWGIGAKAKDNGVLLLMAANDRKVWIATGYGLEGAIPDAIASQISNQIMVPEFKQGRLSNGLLLGAAAVAHLAAKEYNISLDGVVNYANAIDMTPARPAIRFLRFLITLSFFILLFGFRSGLLFYFLLGSAGRRRNGMWYGTGFGGSSGGFGGGFGGFGGGMTGGGGAGGSW